MDPLEAVLEKKEKKMIGADEIEQLISKDKEPFFLSYDISKLSDDIQNEDTWHCRMDIGDKTPSATIGLGIFNAWTCFSVKTDEVAEVIVRDLMGKVFSTLELGTLSAGTHRVVIRLAIPSDQSGILELRTVNGDCSLKMVIGNDN